MSEKQYADKFEMNVDVQWKNCLFDTQLKHITENLVQWTNRSVKSKQQKGVRVLYTNIMKK